MSAAESIRSHFSEGGVVTTQHLVLGTMRLREQLTGIGNTVARFEKQMEELINKEIEVFKAMYLKKRTALSDF